MKPVLKLFPLFIILLIFSCENKNKEINKDELKKEIFQTEKEFAQKVKDEGITDAFLFYASDDAVLMRNNKIIKGKDSMKKFFDTNRLPSGYSLIWNPDFVDISVSGDMAYTYGKFTFSFPDSSGVLIKHAGIFHTVWKKQTDGLWKFVWD